MSIPWNKHSYTQNPICPHCGHECRDAWELCLDEDEVEEVECGECREPYRVERLITIEYNTKKLNQRSFGYRENDH